MSDDISTDEFDEDVEYEDYVSEEASELSVSPDLRITIYGGKREEVKESIDTHLGSDTKFYQTWITLSVLKRLGFVFEGGVESSGSLTGVVCMFILIIVIFAVFFFWQFIVFFIVIGVLALFSGGAALRYLRGTFIESQTKTSDFSKLETFAQEQIEAGRFVKVDCDIQDTELGPIAKKATSTTGIFELGIWLSLLIATLFLVFQVIYWVINGHWISGLNPESALQEIYFLSLFGLAFLLSIIIMDIGVLKRGQLETELSGGYSSLSLPSS
jgi:ABC-type multidrug transport system fused ATPase/permease subunit